MKILIKFLSIIGLLSMSHAAVAIDNVSDGDVLTADTMNEIIDATNANSARGFDFVIGDPLCGGGTVYSPGDTGPAGGLVVLVSADGCDGMEAWTADETNTLWGCRGTATGAVGTSIGTGGPNSLIIENAACITAANTVPVIRGMAYGGETDWFLPSAAELDAMYNSIGPGGNNAGNFDSAGVYWSSSETSALDVWVVNFANGNKVENPKDFNRLSRAVRYFTQP